MKKLDILLNLKIVVHEKKTQKKTINEQLWQDCLLIKMEMKILKLEKLLCHASSSYFTFEFTYARPCHMKYTVNV